MSPPKPRSTTIAKAAYRAVFGDLGTFFAAASPWVFVTAFAHMAFDDAFAESDGFIRPYAFMTLQLSLTVPFLVSWHRRVLKGEPLSPLRMLRFDSRDWRFFQVSLLVVAVGLAPLIMLAPIGYLFIINRWSGYEIVLAWIPLIILISIVFSSIKLSLAFPMAALDRARGAIKEAFRLSRGQEWMLASALFLSTAPLWIVNRGLKVSVESLWSSPKTYPLSLALYLIALLSGYLFLALAASTASFAYLMITKSQGDRIFPTK